MEFTRAERISLKNHSTLDEKWVQELIAKDPSVLGLGDLILKDRERQQPRAGRLDLLLQDAQSGRRYELELQLGAVDESHIIRTVEYWDIERRRFPQYDHCAIIVAEEITGRFLNVISLFNGHIPLIAIQMNALKVGDQFTLIFTTVLDELPLGLEEEETEPEATDRDYWIKRASKDTVHMADELLDIVKSFAADYELTYKKHYMGLATDGHANNFVVFHPKKKFVRLEVSVPQSDAMEQMIDEAGLDVMDYDSRWKIYRVRLHGEDIEQNREVLLRLFKEAYDHSNR